MTLWRIFIAQFCFNIIIKQSHVFYILFERNILHTLVLILVLFFVGWYKRSYPSNYHLSMNLIIAFLINMDLKCQ